MLFFNPKMEYSITLKKRAVKDLDSIPVQDRLKVIERMEVMGDNLSGDVKKLTNHTPEYRMRYGNWRVLFEIEGNQIIVYRVLNRKEAY